jgi:hypothetical protein
MQSVDQFDHKMLFSHVVLQPALHPSIENLVAEQDAVRLQNTALQNVW